MQFSSLVVENGVLGQVLYISELVWDKEPKGIHRRYKSWQWVTFTCGQDSIRCDHEKLVQQWETTISRWKPILEKRC